MKSKHCLGCQETKTSLEFSKNTREKDSFQNWCKNCMEEYYSKNKSKISKQTKKYRDKNKQKVNKRNKEYYLKNKGQINKQSKEYRDQNREKIHQSDKKRYLENKDKKLKYQKEYQKNNKDKRNQYETERKRSDINYKMRCNLSTRICAVLKGKNKSLPTMMLVGCEIDYLMFHLQCQFTKGMTWDNYGEWHIDHIKPCASFDLSKLSEQEKCFHYTNLQPLWAEDNLKKGCKF